jgi:hypothetical protein
MVCTYVTVNLVNCMSGRCLYCTVRHLYVRYGYVDTCIICVCPSMLNEIIDLVRRLASVWFGGGLDLATRLVSF